MTYEINKPYWCNFEQKRDDIWLARCIGYPVFYGSCETCVYYKSKERKLDDWIKPFVDSVNERFKQC